MIANLSKPSNFADTIDYLFQDRKSHELITANTISSHPKGIAREFDYDANGNPRVKVPARHFSISMAPQDGEVDKRLQAVIAKEFLVKMGFLLPAKEEADRSQRHGDCLYLVVRHGRFDPDHGVRHEHDHFHILTSTVNCYGKKIPDSWEYYRAMDSLREIEEEFSLYKVPQKSDSIHLSHGQKQRLNKELREVAEGNRESVDLPISMKLRSIIAEATTDKPSANELMDRLPNYGVEVRLRELPSGKLGVSYSLEGVSFPGSRLKCSINQLAAQGRITTSTKVQKDKDFVIVPLSQIQGNTKNASLHLERT